MTLDMSELYMWHKTLKKMIGQLDFGKIKNSCSAKDSTGENDDKS